MGKKNKEKQVVSAYETEGKRRTQKTELTTGFKILLVFLYILGFAGAMAIIVLLTKCQG